MERFSIVRNLFGVYTIKPSWANFLCADIQAAAEGKLED